MDQGVLIEQMRAGSHALLEYRDTLTGPAREIVNEAWQRMVMAMLARRELQNEAGQLPREPSLSYHDETTDEDLARALAVAETFLQETTR